MENAKTLVVEVPASTDPAVYHGMEELQAMSRDELKLQRLKYVAQKIKCDQKLAKSRVKMYGASLKLKDRNVMAVA